MDEVKDWQRLAEVGTKRREDQGWSQMEVATRGGLSLDSVQALESARRTEYRPKTLLRYEQGLLWARGSVQAILLRGEPTLLEGGYSAAEGGGQTLPADDEAIEWQAYEMLRSVLGVFGRAAFESALRRLRNELDHTDSVRHTERASDGGRVS